MHFKVPNIKALHTLFILLIIILLSFLSYYFGFFYDLNIWASDKLFDRPSQINNNIKIITIDEKTLDEYGNVSSWSRQKYADLINFLNSKEDYSPEIIAFDVTYGNICDEAGDKNFAYACKNSGNVITASTFLFDTAIEYSTWNVNNLHIKNFESPFSPLKENVSYGFTNALQDKDNYIRHSIVSFDYNDETIYSFPFLIYKTHCENTGQTVNYPKTDSTGKFRFTYSAKPSSRYEYFSMSDVLEGKYSPEIFDNCIVLVGAYASGMQDSYFVPIARGSVMYGVEIHANIIDSLTKQTTTIPLNPLLSAVICTLITSAFTVIIRKHKLHTCFIILILISAADIISALVFYKFGYTYNIITCLIIIYCVFIFRVATRYTSIAIQKKKLISSLKKYVPPQLVESRIKNENYDITFEGKTKEIAIFFADIRNFTAISEELSPENVVSILNEYLTLITQTIFENLGTLDKFMGDSAMAIFNAPFDIDDYLFRCVKTAYQIVENSTALRYKFKRIYDKNICCGIGINCGTAVIGNIGPDFRTNYTAIGDSVNIAARLESIAEENQILITEDVYLKLKGRISVTPLGKVSLKGKSNDVSIYQLDGIIE